MQLKKEFNTCDPIFISTLTRKKNILTEAQTLVWRWTITWKKMFTVHIECIHFKFSFSKSILIQENTWAHT